MENKSVIIPKYDRKEITYKLQANNHESWIVVYYLNDEVVYKEMVYESPTNKHHNEKLAEVLKKYNYESLADVLIWVDDVDYGEEAKAILDWWKKTCKDVITYTKLNPNEETAGSFLETLTIFEAPTKKQK